MRGIRVLFLSAALIAAVTLGGAAPAGAQSLPQQCPVVVANTTLQTDCVGPMVVLADDVNVNLNRHQVTCNGDPVRDGIVVAQRFGVHIENGHVHDCRQGIRLDGGGGHHLNNLHVDGHRDTGIRLLESHGNRLVDDELTANDRAVLLVRSDGNELTRLDVHDNRAGVLLGLTGVPASGSNDANRLSGLRIVRQGARGLSIDVGSSDNVVTGSVVTDTVGIGFYVNGDRNEILGNEVSGTQRQDEGVFQGNGLTLTEPSDENVVRANRIRANARYGLEVRGDDNLLAANHVTDNGQHGITAGTFTNDPSAMGNVYQGNTALGNGGFDLADFAPGLCTLNAWPVNHGVKLHDGCENG